MILKIMKTANKKYNNLIKTKIDLADQISLGLD